MPRLRTSQSRPPPEGFEDIEDVLEEYERQMRDAEAAPDDGKPKNEVVWPILQINHARSRYIYELYYKREAISRELYDWLVRERYADTALITKWKKQGYEKLCCVQCIQANDGGATCICRIPRIQLRRGLLVQCHTCGCRGCASTD